MQTLAQLDYDPAVTIRQDASLEAALARLLESNTTELFVTDVDDHLLGIVPDYELLKARLAGDWSEGTVGQLMSHRLLCFTLETPLAEALRAFRESQHSRAAILQGSRLIGQLTRRTLLRALSPAQTTNSTIAPPKFLNAYSASTRSPA